MEKRRKIFTESIRKGRTFACLCCERLCFENGVKSFNKSQIASNLYDRAIGKTSYNENKEYFLCITCNSYISKEKIPPMSIQNKLKLLDISNKEELKLSELENSMIALNIIFQEVFKLPKSRWPAMKDKTVNIPIIQLGLDLS